MTTPVSKWRAAGQQHPVAPDRTRTDNRCIKSGFVSWAFVFPDCATAHASPGWSSRHRRPTRWGAGQAPRVKVEHPTG